MKTTLEYIENLEAAIIDLIDGNFEKDIQYFTGCSEERSTEIRNLYSEVIRNYFKKHNL